MKKKILSTLLAGAAVATMGAASAQAGTLDSVAGNIKFLFDGFDGAQTSYAPTADGTLCGSIALCNGVSTPSYAPGSDTAGGEVNDTYGFAFVSGIKPSSGGGGNLWNAGTVADGSEYLLVYFHGFEDSKVEFFGGQTISRISSEGGYADVYRLDRTMLNTIIVDPLDDTSAATFGNQLDIKSAVSGFGPAYLNLEFVYDPIACPINPVGTTLCGTFDGGIANGSSSGRAQVVGGTAMNKYKQNFDFLNPTEACGDNITCSGSFNIAIRDGSAITFALPEPGTLGLLGLGLVGLGLAGRRRKAA